jgi:hypothetical protein
MCVLKEHAKCGNKIYKIEAVIPKDLNNLTEQKHIDKTIEFLFPALQSKGKCL